MFQQSIITRSGLTVSQEIIGSDCVDFLQAGSRLVITFENAGGQIDRGDKERDASSLSFLAKRGFSVLGVKASKDHWYRNDALHAFMRSDRLKDLLAGFDDVTFMGASMGGYAAIAFSQIFPGSLVVAMSPQSTMNRKIVPWEKRSDKGSSLDWKGHFYDAAAAVPLARRIYNIHDPFQPEDRAHARRLDGSNVVHLKAPFLGHKCPIWLSELGLLRPTIEQTLDETMTPAVFARMVKARRDLPRYYLNASNRMRQRGFLAAAECAAHQAIKLDPKSDDGRRALARVRQAQGKNPPAAAPAKSRHQAEDLATV